jgi:pSer/pThr/pTyr-binding forkhead associated (FHA) protein
MCGSPSGNTVAYPGTRIATGPVRFALVLSNNEILTFSNSFTLGRENFRGKMDESKLLLISRFHCYFKVGPEGVSIEDGGPEGHSRNGTAVNGKPVSHSEFMPLNTGDRITLAGVLDLTFRQSQ